ncbi:hypothetical protein SLEP1_g59817 [Rubroshorea leprosula]|uniref:Uncharacterized protein n=1 Tax=Rubroshorea leprosula TaxID=152421 RepID=A0AAV5HMI3_9ROSI|nr:hypothetical protein SLEP1_g2297 [Rubroshorea leprosula]GKV53282.1 hypothetical protein SLEP1_g59817 [Rubroshorea leprosula]
MHQSPYLDSTEVSELLKTRWEKQQKTEQLKKKGERQNQRYGIVGVFCMIRSS